VAALSSVLEQEHAGEHTGTQNAAV